MIRDGYFSRPIRREQWEDELRKLWAITIAVLLGLTLPFILFVFLLYTVAL